ncbi:MAG TPA: SRPBCC family protein [Acidimicrobiales bacterium]|nr:SRPBCC family protein [Acidimicrobiales bacterium]
MPVTSVEKDLDALTLVIVADFDAPLQRLWDTYADPRKIERFWGPTTYPAKFNRHDFFVGGHSNYTMTGPDGDTSSGFWEFLAVDAPKHFEVLDGFAASDGTPNLDMPTMRMTFDFTATDTGSRLSMTTYFNAADEYEKLLEMGMEEGTLSAMSQIDAVVADLRAFAAELPAAAQLLDDTTVRVARVVRGTVDQVWAAHFEPDLVRRWMLGPDGWSMPLCETSTQVGGNYKYVWRNDEDGSSFGSTGEILEVEAPHRARFTEHMAGDFIPEDAPGTVDELTLIPVDGGTLVTMVITYPDAATRDAVLATGMVDGMESSFQRLETTILGA